MRAVARCRFADSLIDAQHPLYCSLSIRRLLFLIEECSETEAERHGGDDYLLINSPIVSKTEL